MWFSFRLCSSHPRAANEAVLKTRIVDFFVKVEGALAGQSKSRFGVRKLEGRTQTSVVFVNLCPYIHGSILMLAAQS